MQSAAGPQQARHQSSSVLLAVVATNNPRGNGRVAGLVCAKAYDRPEALTRMLASRRAALLLLLLRLRLGHMHLGRAGSRLGLSLLAAAALGKQDDKHTPSYSRPFFCCTCTWYLQPVLELTPLGHLLTWHLPGCHCRSWILKKLHPALIFDRGGQGKS